MSDEEIERPSTIYVLIIETMRGGGAWRADTLVADITMKPSPGLGEVR